MMHYLACADIFPTDTNEAGRKAVALSLLSAVNLAFRGAGHAGCTLDVASVTPSATEPNISIITISAKPGPEPATYADLRAAYKKAG